VKEHKNNTQTPSIKHPENIIQKSSNHLNVLAPITTYSQTTSHKPLILTKASHQSFNSISNNSQNKNNHYFYNGYHLKSNHSIDSVNKTSFNNSPNGFSNQINRIKGVKIIASKPQSDNDLAKIDRNNSNNLLKAEIKVPKMRKRGSADKLKYCKRCEKSFPGLSSKEFKEHIYNVCPARGTQTLLSFVYYHFSIYYIYYSLNLMYLLKVHSLISFLSEVNLI